LFAGVIAEGLRMAIGRACRDVGVPHVLPDALRRRLISRWHRQGIASAEVGAGPGQHRKLMTADSYGHAQIGSDSEVDRSEPIARASTLHTPVRTS
jgi:hypothetical protein